jgi:hypothetical protein
MLFCPHGFSALDLVEMGLHTRVRLVDSIPEQFTVQSAHNPDRELILHPGPIITVCSHFRKNKSQIKLCLTFGTQSHTKSYLYPVPKRDS